MYSETSALTLVYTDSVCTETSAYNFYVLFKISFYMICTFVCIQCVYNMFTMFTFTVFVSQSLQKVFPSPTERR